MVVSAATTHFFTHVLPRSRLTLFFYPKEVHCNNGIINYAFVVMSEGGSGKPDIWVEPVNPDFDTAIDMSAQSFYKANTKCFTESTDFVAARECVLMFSIPAAGLAWDLVGIRAIQTLNDGTNFSGLSLLYEGDVQVFVLDKTVNRGQTVTCNAEGANGDPDLYVNFGYPPDLSPEYNANSCSSSNGGLVEECTTGPAKKDRTEVFIAVEAEAPSTDITLRCKIYARQCQMDNQKCTKTRDCCPNSELVCDGPTVGTRKCKTCVKNLKACKRHTQCCPEMKCKAVVGANKKMCLY
jgi:Thermolysin metallopeptidase, alpha-helical domain